jgi:hypothetical protein
MCAEFWQHHQFVSVEAQMANLGLTTGFFDKLDVEALESNEMQSLLGHKHILVYLQLPCFFVNRAFHLITIAVPKT